MTSPSPILPQHPWKEWPTTHDGMFGKKVLLEQHKKGYRFSIDPVLLTYFMTPKALTAQNIVDLGTGSGIIPLLLAHILEQKDHHPQITAIEIQPSLAALARKNIEQNQREKQIQLIHADIRQLSPPPSKWDLLTFNPPYGQPQQGKIPQNPEKAAARHELNGTLPELLKKITPFLKKNAFLGFVYPASATLSLLDALSSSQLHPSRLRYVHPFAHSEAKLILLEATPQPTKLLVESPLILYIQHRLYTDEAHSIFNGLF